MEREDRAKLRLNFRLVLPHVICQVQGLTNLCRAMRSASANRRDETEKEDLTLLSKAELIDRLTRAEDLLVQLTKGLQQEIRAKHKAEDQVQTVVASNGRLRSELDNVKKQLSSQGSNADKDSSDPAMRSKMQKQEAEIARLRSRVIELVQGNEKLKASNRTTPSRIELRRQLLITATEKDELAKENAALQQQVEKLNRQSSGANSAEARRLTRENTELQRQLGTVTADREAANRKIDQLMSGRDGMLKAISELQAQLSENRVTNMDDSEYKKIALEVIFSAADPRPLLQRYKLLDYISFAGSREDTGTAVELAQRRDALVLEMLQFSSSKYGAGHWDQLVSALHYLYAPDSAVLPTESYE